MLNWMPWLIVAVFGAVEAVKVRRVWRRERVLTEEARRRP